MKDLLTPSHVSQVYSGKKDGCRCGCKGKYYRSALHPKEGECTNDRMVKKILTAINAAPEYEKMTGLDGETIYNIDLPDSDRCYTAYMKWEGITPTQFQ